MAEGSWPPYFMETPLHYLSHLFQILSNPPPLLPPTPTPSDQVGDRATFDKLFCLMILWIHTCQTLVPQYQKDLDVCFMQQDVKLTEVLHVWFFAGTLKIWYHTHTAHSETSRLTHPYKYIFTSLCAHSSYLYYTEWIIHWYHKNSLSTLSFLFKNYSLVKVIHLLIRCFKTRFFLKLYWYKWCK